MSKLKILEAALADHFGEWKGQNYFLITIDDDPEVEEHPSGQHEARFFVTITHRDLGGANCFRARVSWLGHVDMDVTDEDNGWKPLTAARLFALMWFNEVRPRVDAQKEREARAMQIEEGIV